MSNCCAEINIQYTFIVTVEYSYNMCADAGDVADLAEIYDAIGNEGDIGCKFRTKVFIVVMLLLILAGVGIGVCVYCYRKRRGK